MIPPKISIIIPSFNQLTFLRKAVKSIEDQKYPSFELIVVDGGSEDGTKEFLEQKKNVITKWISEKDNGQTEALNKGFRLASGEIFGWLNCDERYLPGTLLKIGNLFSVNPGLDIAFGNRIVVDLEGKEIEKQKSVPLHPFEYALYAAGLLFSDSTFWKAELHKKTGDLDEVLCRRYGMDYDWFFRMGLNVKRWLYIDDYLSVFTEYKGRISKNVKEMSAISQAIRKKVFEIANINPYVVVAKAPFYLAYSRYKRFGIRGLFHFPALKSITRTAGISKII